MPKNSSGLRPMHVGELAVQRHGHGRGQQVDREQPGELGEAADVLHDRGDRGRDDRAVERHQAGGQHQGAEDRAPLGPEPDPLGGGRGRGSGSCQGTTDCGALYSGVTMGLPGVGEGQRSPSRLQVSKNTCYLRSEPQKPPFDGVLDGKLPAPGVRRGPQRGLEPQPRDGEDDQPGQPRRRQLRPGGAGARPSWLRRARPHRRTAHRRRAASRRRAGDRAPGRAGRRARHRLRIAAARAEELDLVEAFVRGGGGLVVLGGVRPGQVRQQPAGAARPLRHRDRQHHRAGGRPPAPERRDLGARRHRRHRRPGRCSPAWPRPASTASGVLPLDGAPGAQVLARHQRHRRPGRPAAGRGAAGRPAAGSSSSPTPTCSATTRSRSSTTAPCGPTSSPGAPVPPPAPDALAATAASDRCRRRRARRALAGAQGRGHPHPAAAVQGRLDRRRDPRPGRGAPAGRTRSPREIAALAPRFPHDADYLDGRRRSTSRRWADEGFGTPDFLDSLVLFRPDQHRVDGLQHLVVFPMYTQNGNLDRNVEALSDQRRLAAVAGRAGADLRQPDVPAGQLRRLHPRLRHQLRGALPRDGRGARGAEVPPGAPSSATARPPASAGSAPPPRRRWACSCPRTPSGWSTTRAWPRDAFAMWDLIHDRTHSHGDLPFDPFMIKQRMPFWMYALEELRCDLTTFREAVRAGGAGRALRHARAARHRAGPAVPLPDHRRPGPQLRRARRPAAVRLPAPSRRPALDRQPAQPRLEAAAAGRDRPGPRGRGALPRRHRPLPRGALAGVVRAGLALRRHRTRARPGPRAPWRCRWTGRRST